MAQITLDLDDDTLAWVEQAAKAQGLPVSRWVADVIRKHAADEWPQDCLALAGCFAEFPLCDAGDANGASPLTADVPRLG